MKKYIAILLTFACAFTTFLSGAVSAYAATDTFDQTVNFSVGDAITLGGNATINFGSTLTPGGSSVSATGNVTVSTNADGGFTLAAERSTTRSTTTQHSTEGTAFPEKTVWNSSGNGNAASWSGDGFGFRVQESGTYADAFNSTWWGTDASAKYAGIPNNGASNNIVAQSSTAQDNTSRTIVMEYQAEAPATQTSGSYQGTVTYTGTTQ